MTGERRLTSIKTLLESLVINLGPIELQQPITIEIDGQPINIDITSLPTIMAQITALPNVTIATIPSITISSIPNIIVSSLPALTGSLTIANNPLVTKEQQTSLTFTSSVVSVTSASTLVLTANANRKYLLIQRGTTAGRVFVKMGSGAATVTNGMLFRENAYFTLNDSQIYTGEINAIAVGSNKILYVTEGQ